MGESEFWNSTKLMRTGLRKSTTGITHTYSCNGICMKQQDSATCKMQIPKTPFTPIQISDPIEKELDSWIISISLVALVVHI